jgi:hypothetical protein
MDLKEFAKIGVTIAAEDLEKIAGKVFNPVKRWSHRLLLDKIMKENKLNAVTNMLLAEGGVQVGRWLTDAPDSRRLLLKFKNGKLGIITSTKSMSTDRLVKIALGYTDKDTGESLVDSVVYMDTGMYDSYEVVTQDKRSHYLGHRDSDASTNRIFWSYKKGE